MDLTAGEKNFFVCYKLWDNIVQDSVEVSRGSCPPLVFLVKEKSGAMLHEYV